MAQRKIHATRVSKRCAVNIYWSAEWNEYVVKQIVDGRIQSGPGSGYFTTDKQDARDTAAVIARSLRRSPRCR